MVLWIPSGPIVPGSQWPNWSWITLAHWARLVPRHIGPIGRIGLGRPDTMCPITQPCDDGLDSFAVVAITDWSLRGRTRHNISTASPYWSISPATFANHLNKIKSHWCARRDDHFSENPRPSKHHFLSWTKKLLQTIKTASLLILANRRCRGSS